MSRRPTRKAPKRPWQAGTATKDADGFRAGLPHTFGFLLIEKAHGIGVFERPDGSKAKIELDMLIARTPDGRWLDAETG